MWKLKQRKNYNPKYLLVVIYLIIFFIATPILHASIRLYTVGHYNDTYKTPCGTLMGEVVSKALSLRPPVTDYYYNKTYILYEFNSFNVPEEVSLDLVGAVVKADHNYINISSVKCNNNKYKSKIYLKNITIKKLNSFPDPMYSRLDTKINLTISNTGKHHWEDVNSSLPVLAQAILSAAGPVAQALKLSSKAIVSASIVGSTAASLLPYVLKGSGDRYNANWIKIYIDLYTTNILHGLIKRYNARNVAVAFTVYIKNIDRWAEKQGPGISTATVVYEYNVVYKVKLYKKGDHFWSPWRKYTDIKVNLPLMYYIKIEYINTSGPQFSGGNIISIAEPLHPLNMGHG